MHALLGLGRVFELHRIEIAGDDGFGFLVGRVDDPEHKKERHHRGHEIRERDLPGAAMMAMAADDFLLDDDDIAVGMCRPSDHPFSTMSSMSLVHDASSERISVASAATLISTPSSSTYSTSTANVAIFFRNSASSRSGPLHPNEVDAAGTREPRDVLRQFVDDLFRRSPRSTAASARARPTARRGAPVRRTLSAIVSDSRAIFVHLKVEFLDDGALLHFGALQRARGRRLGLGDIETFLHAAMVGFRQPGFQVDGLRRGSSRCAAASRRGTNAGSSGRTRGRLSGERRASAATSPERRNSGSPSSLATASLRGRNGFADGVARALTGSIDLRLKYSAIGVAFMRPLLV